MRPKPWGLTCRFLGYLNVWFLERRGWSFGWNFDPKTGRLATRWVRLSRNR